MTVSPNLPFPHDGAVYLDIMAFETGLLSTPASALVAGAQAACSATSWRFFIHHKQQGIKFWFDMGISSDLTSYVTSVQRIHNHFKPKPSKRSMSEDTLLAGSQPSEVKYVIASHGHWDHVRPLPEEFSNATMILGPGSLAHCSPGFPAKVDSIFDGRVFDQSLRKFPLRELPPASDSGSWARLGPFPHALDFFGDGSFFLVDGPGHLPGNLAALCRVQTAGNKKKWVLLGGDCAHCNLFTYWPATPFGKIPSALLDHNTLHHDPAEARATIEKIAQCKAQLGEDFLVWYAHSEILEGVWEFGPIAA